MDAREYLSVYRAYNLVRQDVPSSERLTFAELAILCKLRVGGKSLSTSEISDYQGALRPTMTHRAKRLEKFGYLSRIQGSEDGRNVLCSVTEEGLACTERLLEMTCSRIAKAQPLGRVQADRMLFYVSAMGSLTLSASELILLGLWLVPGRRATVTNLTVSLGLLQPTVSMSLSALIKDALVVREGEKLRSAVALSEAGAEVACDLERRIESIVVRRK